MDGLGWGEGVARWRFGSRVDGPKSFVFARRMVGVVTLGEEVDGAMFWNKRMWEWEGPARVAGRHLEPKEGALVGESVYRVGCVVEWAMASGIDEWQCLMGG
jgi:hypothetical protein